MRLFTFILVLLLCSAYSFGQVQLFSLNNESIIIATKDKENTIGLNLNSKVYRDIISKKYQNILIKLPFFHNSVNLRLGKPFFSLESLEIYNRCNFDRVCLFFF